MALLLVIGPGVHREDVRAVGDAYKRLGGDEREREPDQVMRDRVVVAIDAPIRLLPGGDWPDGVAVP